ncbi:hypothetical protein [Tabrizicola sp.]|uniref:hypothetical protein n=1 Tax=Tabrizicola sp. TaxID=2005166 RepID=UPI003F2D60C5
MKGLLELISLLSVIVCLGAVFWAGLGLLSVSNEVGDASLRTREVISGPLIVAAAAVAINLAAGFVRKRL